MFICCIPWWDHNDNNPTVHIHIQMRIHIPVGTGKYKYNIQANTVVQARIHLLISWLRFFDKRRETHFCYFADHTIWPHQQRRILRCLRSLSIEIRKPQLHLQWSKSNSQLKLNSLGPNGRELNYLPTRSNVNLQLTLFKILKFTRLFLLGMTSSTLLPHFLSGDYYDYGDCHILCARA